jgi:hypothetical protein
MEDPPFASGGPLINAEKWFRLLRNVNNEIGQLLL